MGICSRAHKSLEENEISTSKDGVLYGNPGHRLRPRLECSLPILERATSGNKELHLAIEDVERDEVLGLKCIGRRARSVGHPVKKYALALAERTSLCGGKGTS